MDDLITVVYRPIRNDGVDNSSHIPKITISFILTIFLGTFFWFLGLGGNYELWHSLWHLCVFTASGLGCKARNLLYRKYYSNDLTERSTEMRIYSRTTSTSI